MKLIKNKKDLYFIALVIVSLMFLFMAYEKTNLEEKYIEQYNELINYCNRFIPQHQQIGFNYTYIEIGELYGE